MIFKWLLGTRSAAKFEKLPSTRSIYKEIHNEKNFFFTVSPLLVLSEIQSLENICPKSHIKSTGTLGQKFCPPFGDAS